MMSKRQLSLLILTFLFESALLGFHAYAFQIYKPLISPSDSLNARSWTIDDGLPVNTVNSIVQDKKGFLWLTTYDGLVRFDGENFKIFDHSNTPLMPHNRTTQLHIDKNGGKWIALEYGGVLHINGNRTRFFDSDNGFTTRDIIQIKENANGNLFFNTHNGLYRYKDDVFMLIFKGKSKLQQQIRDFLYADNGIIWLATRDGLIELDTQNNTQKAYFIDEGSLKNDFYSIHKTLDGEILVGTRSGLYVFKNGSLQMPTSYLNTSNTLISYIYEDDQILLISTSNGIFKIENGTTQFIEGSNELNNVFKTFFRDSRGTLWMIGKKGLLATLQGQTIQKFSSISYFINNIYEDKEQNIWLASVQGGLIMLRRSLVETIGTPEGLSGDNILALYKDSQNHYWVSARSNWLNFIENGKVKQFPKSDINSNTILSIEEDQKGTMLFGTLRNGIYRLENGQLINYPISTDIDKNTVRAIFSSSADSIWLGTYNGLLLMNGELDLIQEFNTDNGLSGNKIRYITETQNGTLLVGTMSNGLDAIKNDTIKNYSVNDGLSSNNIRSIYVDEDKPNTLWVGTGINGLNRILDESIQYLTEEDGLPNNNIHWISQDSQGWLWISTNMGIARLYKADVNSYLNGEINAYRQIHYGKQEGMRNPEGNGAFQEAGIRDDNDEFWFATQDGVAIIKAGAVNQQVYDPHVLIREIVADNQVFNGDSLEFEPGVNDLQIYFNGISFSYPERARFRYKIEELHSSWIDIGTQKQLLISNLSPNTYTLVIQTSNVAGEWSPYTSSLTFTITPRFYQNWWFYVLALGGLWILIHFVIKIRYKRLIHRQEQLESVIKEQTEEIQKEKNEVEARNKLIQQQSKKLEESNRTKDKFFSIIAHDLRNPFQGLLGFSEILIDEAETIQRSKLKQSLGHIHKSSKSLLSLVENLLNWASLNTGKITPNPTLIDLQKVLHENAELFEQLAQQKGITIQVNAPKQLMLLADHNMIKAIVRNLLSNAIKFTPNDGTVTLSLQSVDQKYIIEVQDTGVGMSDKMIKEVLLLGENTSRDGTNQEKGTGLGLLICKEMVELHHGEISIHSENGKGTRFTLRFPLEGLSKEP
jgi:signal transduction histidine kinase